MMNIKIKIIILYITVVVVAFILSNGLLFPVGAFLLFVNVALAGVFVGLVHKEIESDEDGRKLSGWYAFMSSIVTVIILILAVSQISDHVSSISDIWLYVISMFLVVVIVRGFNFEVQQLTKFVY